MNADAEQGGELPLKVVFGKARNTAEDFDAQVVIEMRVDMVQYSLHARMILPKGVLLHVDSGLSIASYTRAEAAA